MGPRVCLGDMEKLLGPTGTPLVIQPIANHYTGWTTVSPLVTLETNKTTDILLRLAEMLLEKTYAVWLDNCYTPLPPLVAGH